MILLMQIEFNNLINPFIYLELTLLLKYSAQFVYQNAILNQDGNTFKKELYNQVKRGLMAFHFN
ncbi:unnamed protein product [Paramecium sonneborni]|uniref:Uncharacterized protein n=1 Tax=Paramecium sonneborni TaxID=65129 RepID=A0A8S1RQX6_9CILI|nr:unnamed protein product [Paramecium sonneborni]